MEIVKGSAFDASGLKYPLLSHHSYRLCSFSEGSKFLGSDAFAVSLETALEVRICRARLRRDAGAEKLAWRGARRPGIAWPADFDDDIDASEHGASVVIGDRTNLERHDLADILGQN